MVDYGGKVLCIDAVLESVTFTHFLEDQIQDKLPFRLYDEAHYTGEVIDSKGRSLEVPTRVLSNESRIRRREGSLWTKARRRGVTRYARVGNTRLILLSCRELADLVDEIYANGESLFSRDV